MKLMSDSLANIAPALVKAQMKMGNAVKDSKNPFFRSNYADLNSVREAVLPPLNEEGISVTQPMVFVDGKKFVMTLFLHTSGEFLAGLTEVVYPKEGDPQAQGSGTTYARRFGLQSMANVGNEDDDGNAASGKTNIRQNAAGPGNTQSVTVNSPTAQATDTAIKSSAVIGASVPSSQPATGGSKSFRKPKTTATEEL
jgi:hypothetical protein